MERVQKCRRLSSFEMPRIYSDWYILYHYFFRDLKLVLDTYVKEHDKVFDIGCGNKPYEKYVLALTKDGVYRGCDIVQSSEEKADIICEATAIPELSDEYDVVLCTQVIEHVFDHSKVFEEAHRLLKQGGYFVVSSNFVWQIHEAPFDYYRFTKYAFQQLLKNAGFRVKECKTNGGEFAALGQLIVHILLAWKSRNFFMRYLRAGMVFLCNIVFMWLDKRCKKENYTLNYVFVGEK